jgi:FkbM family methyltransferase
MCERYRFCSAGAPNAVVVLDTLGHCPWWCVTGGGLFVAASPEVLDGSQLMIRSLAKSLLARLNSDQKYFLLRELANSFGISSVTVDGPIGPIAGNPNDWTIFRRYVHGQSWESSTSAICIDFFRRHGPGTFVDVGANIGMIFIPVVKEANCFGVAIEASPINFSDLAVNCMRNLPIQSYKLNHVAVGDRAGKIRFDVSGVNFGNHRVSESGNIEVQAACFDELYDARNFAKPVLVKVDIQGHEPEFLAGAENLLSACDALILEYSPFGQKGYDWVEGYDRRILQFFSRMARYGDRTSDALHIENSAVKLDRNALDKLKEDISARKWADMREAHENIMLFRT